MSSHARHPTARMFAALLVMSGGLFRELEATAQSTSDLPEAAEPYLAEEGDWAADFNQAQIACYQGSMRACDSIWLSQRVLIDSWLSEYGRSCGGRVDPRAIRRANLTCVEAFPDYE